MRLSFDAVARHRGRVAAVAFSLFQDQRVFLMVSRPHARSEIECGTVEPCSLDRLSMRDTRAMCLVI